LEASVRRQGGAIRPGGEDRQPRRKPKRTNSTRHLHPFRKGQGEVSPRTRRNTIPRSVGCAPIWVIRCEIGGNAGATWRQLCGERTRIGPNPRGLELGPCRRRGKPRCRLVGTDPGNDEHNSYQPGHNAKPEAKAARAEAPQRGAAPRSREDRFEIIERRRCFAAAMPCQVGSALHALASNGPGSHFRSLPSATAGHFSRAATFGRNECHD
jgi:hypothetical protein